MFSYRYLSYIICYITICTIINLSAVGFLNRIQNNLKSLILTTYQEKKVDNSIILVYYVTPTGSLVEFHTVSVVPNSAYKSIYIIVYL